MKAQRYAKGCRFEDRDDFHRIKFLICGIPTFARRDGAGEFDVALWTWNGMGPVFLKRKDNDGDIDTAICIDGS